MKYLVYAMIIFLYTGCVQSSQPIKTIKKDETKIVIKKQEAPKIIEEQEIIEPEIIEEEVVDSAYKVAIVFPSRIMSKYGVGVTKAINAYLLQQNIDTNIEVFDCIDQSYENLVVTFNEIKEKEYENVLALMTPRMVQQLSLIPSLDDIDIYIPTVNKHEIETSMDNLTFGGIDYNKQIELLVNQAKGQIINFYSNRGISKKLTNKLNSIYPNVVNVEISKDTNYTDLFENDKFKHKTIFINTTLIKTSILLSQIRANEVEPYIILTTQLNYNPHLISMTQYDDRKQLYYANSIGNIDELLQENSFLLGTDINYDWVNYSALVGIDYLMRQSNYANSLIQYEIEENQVLYPISLIKNKNFGFSQYLQASN